ncbi:cytochrome P450 [Streptomyces sp. WAC02707]|uniref:cytochrome P450 n=1 Tax=Streptomyces sp. WAC02707 TaxID=2487417 RepID=UPI000F7AA3B3|nr:cytochrome P450 [Streptomyces sp. WAC02707]RSS85172.1 cytochrome P450 [Streptomyces sp. WAC02707]
MLVVTDGPHRQVLRRAMQPFFTAGWTQRYASRLVTAVEDSMMARFDDPELDFARDVAWKVPITAVCSILGLPVQDEGWLCGTANGVLASQDPGITPAEAAATATAARAELIAYLQQLVDKRSRNPGDDLVSALLSGSGQSRLPHQDVVLNVLSILVAANETTRLALAGSMVALACHRDQWERLRTDPSSLKGTVEEILRWTSSGLNVSRTVTGPTRLGGEDLAAGDVVTVWLPAGNRDPAVFAYPYRFNPTRRGPAHLAFGHGPHHCIGAALARTELTVLLDFLTARVAGWEITGPLRRTHSNALSGYSSVPLRLVPVGR